MGIHPYDLPEVTEVNSERIYVCNVTWYDIMYMHKEQ
jgi:hypothetical protein